MSDTNALVTLGEQTFPAVLVRTTDGLADLVVFTLRLPGGTEVMEALPYNAAGGDHTRMYADDDDFPYRSGIVRLPDAAAGQERGNGPVRLPPGFFPQHKGGSTWTLSNGSSFRGTKAAAQTAQQALAAGGADADERDADADGRLGRSALTLCWWRRDGGSDSSPAKVR
jgi:hypothetical protein